MPVRPLASVRLSVDRLEDRDLPAAPFASLPVVPTIDGGMKIHLREVLGHGQLVGNREDVFAKVGDSITAPGSGSFFPLGTPGYNPIANGLADRPSLLDTLIAYQTAATPFGENSWTRASLAAFPGFRSNDVLPLSPAEIGAVHPAISLIMIGTNDVVHLNAVFYEANLRQLIAVNLNLGVIPVLSTIPPNTIHGGVYQTWVATANQIIADLGDEFDVPVWNYWSAMIGLPGQGVADGVHPSAAPQGSGFIGPGGLGFGYNVRNFTALEVLDHVRDVVFDDAPPDDFAVPPDRAWTPLVPGQPVIATAAAPGTAPLVVLRESDTGAVVNQFLAFDPRFAGGVSVAVGDVNADGVPDVVVGPASGGGPHVRAISGADGSELFSFFAYEPTFTGGVTLAVGDVTGDGIADVVVGSGTGGGPRVRVFDPTTGTIVRDFLAFEESFRGGVNVAVGSFGPTLGRAIVATPGDGGGAVVGLFDAGTLDRVASYQVFAGDFRGGANLAAGDINGNGIDELVIGGGAGTSQVQVLRAENGEAMGEFVAGPVSRGGVRVGVLPGDSGAIVSHVGGDPDGLVGLFDPAGVRLRTLTDPVDEFFPLGVNVGA